MNINSVIAAVSTYLVAIWLLISLIRNAGLFIVHATKNKADDRWFVRYVAKPINFFMPFIQLLPHSTIPVCKILAILANLVPFFKKFLPDSKADEIEKEIEKEIEAEKEK